MITIVDVEGGHRSRLLRGMIAAVADKGYADVTIADVVAEAGVSKRTFYEHFTGKQDCLLACFRDASQRLHAELAVHIGDEVADSGQLGRVLTSWLAFLDRAPEVARTVLMEIQTAGVEGRRLRRESNLEMARMLQDAVSAARGGVHGLDLDQAIAVVGGLTEVVVMHAEDRPGEPFSVLGPGMLRFVSAVLQGAPAGLAGQNTPV